MSNFVIEIHVGRGIVKAIKNIQRIGHNDYRKLVKVENGTLFATNEYTMFIYKGINVTTGVYSCRCVKDSLFLTLCEGYYPNVSHVIDDTAVKFKSLVSRNSVKMMEVRFGNTLDSGKMIGEIIAVTGIGFNVEHFKGVPEGVYELMWAMPVDPFCLVSMEYSYMFYIMPLSKNDLTEVESAKVEDIRMIENISKVGVTSNEY